MKLLKLILHQRAFTYSFGTSRAKAYTLTAREPSIYVHLSESRFLVLLIVMMSVFKISNFKKVFSSQKFQDQSVTAYVSVLHVWRTRLDSEVLKASFWGFFFEKSSKLLLGFYIVQTFHSFVIQSMTLHLPQYICDLVAAKVAREMTGKG